jgi:hypothetical protein
VFGGRRQADLVLAAPEVAVADAPPPPGVETTMRKRRANDLTRAGLESDEGGIPFLCECSSDDCYRTVWATAPEYDTTFAASPLLAPGHAAAAPAPPA